MLPNLDEQPKDIPIPVVTKSSSLEDLIKYVGAKNHHVMVRIDPLRVKGRFSVIVDGNRVGDTDKPTLMLWEHIIKEKI